MIYSINLFFENNVDSLIKQKIYSFFGSIPRKTGGIFINID